VPHSDIVLLQCIHSAHDLLAEHYNKAPDVDGLAKQQITIKNHINTNAQNFFYKSHMQTHSHTKANDLTLLYVTLNFPASNLRTIRIRTVSSNC